MTGCVKGSLQACWGLEQLMRFKLFGQEIV